MKETYTHVGLAVLVTLIVYALAFSAAFEELKRNVLGVIMLFIVMATMGYFYAKIFYEERTDGKRKSD